MNKQRCWTTLIALTLCHLLPKIFELKAKIWFQGSLWVLKNCGFLFFNFSPLNNPISEKSLQRWQPVATGNVGNTLKNSVNIQKSTAIDYFHSHPPKGGL